MKQTTSINYIRSAPYTLKALRETSCTPESGWCELYHVALTVDKGNCLVSTLYEKTYKSEKRAIACFEKFRREIWG